VHEARDAVVRHRVADQGPARVEHARESAPPPHRIGKRPARVGVAACLDAREHPESLPPSPWTGSPDEEDLPATPDDAQRLAERHGLGTRPASAFATGDA